MGNKETITIYDVARTAGVSMATVSRVVNGNPNVKPATRKRVLSAIEELGYRPNAIARGLASKKTTTIGIIIPDISNTFYAELTRGIEDIATMYRYNIILSNSDLKVIKELELIETLLEKQVDGLLFLGGHVTDEHRRIFNKTAVPVVLVATRDEQGEMPFVSIEQKEAAREATQVFVQEGNQRIGFIGGSLTDSIKGYPRYLGYKEAILDAGLALDESLIQIGDSRYQSGYDAMKELLKLPEPPTATFVTSDEMAVGAIHAALDQGVKIPEEMSIMGFNNIPLATQVRPLLSTVYVPMYDIGAVAMRLLTKYIHKENIETGQVLLPFSIKLRDSTRLKEW